MEFRSLPLFLFLFVVIVSCFGLATSSSSENTASKSALTIRDYDRLKEQDSLEVWLTSKKKESQFYRSNGDYDSTKIILDNCLNEIWRAPQTEEEFKQLGWIYVNRAYIFEKNSGDYLQAKSDYLNALDQFDQCNYEDYFVARFVLEPLGNILTRLGENEQAIILLTRFQRISKECDQHEALLDSHNDLGRAYTNKSDYPKAIETLKTGIELGEKYYYSSGLLYSSLSEAYLDTKDFEKGIESGNLSLINFKKAINQVDQLSFRYGQIQEYLIGMQMTLAELNAATSNYNEAKSLFDQALLSAQEIYQTKNRNISKIHLGLAQSHIQLAQLEDGMESYQNALRSVIPNFNASDVFTNPNSKSLYAEVSIGEGLLGKARTAHELYNSTNEIKWIKLSLKSYSDYFKWEDLLRSEQQNSQSKLLFAAEIHQVGEEALSVLCQLQKIDKRSNCAEFAFKIIEQTKGILLSESRTDLLNNSISLAQNNALKLLQQQKMQLSMFNISLYESELEKDTVTINLCKKKIETLTQSHQLTLFKMKKQFPNHDELIYQRNDTVDINALKHHLKKNKTDILNYFVGQSKSFLVTGQKGTFTLYELNNEKCKELTQDFLINLKSPANANPTNYETTALSLYNELLGVASNDLKSKNWIILPDADLNRIPFEALVCKKKNKSANFKNLHYLLHERITSYAPSAKFILKKKTKKSGLKSYLGIAPVFKNNSDYAWLQNSESEVRIGEEIFSGDVLTGSKASKNAFFNKVEDYKIVHISTHAGLSSGSNNDNWMAFYSKPNNEKSHLVTPELLQLNLSADLVILNACETANGEFYEGEGVLSLSRGFIYAGANNVVTNLWQVNHETNSKLLSSFYSHLQNNNSPSLALQQSKINYLTDERTDAFGGHPYFWAAPVLIGNNNSVDLEHLESSSFLIYYILGGVILLFSTFIFFKKRRSRI